MEYFDARAANMSVFLVRFLENKFSQTEKNATVELGVILGVALSVCSVVGIYGLNRWWARNKSVELPSDSDNAESTQGTEGAYRSDSDSDDSDQSVRVSKEAQKRARKENGV